MDVNFHLTFTFYAKNELQTYIASMSSSYHSITLDKIASYLGRNN